MADIYLIILIVNITNLLIGIIPAVIYLLTIILVRRFHNAINILMGNVCLVCIICSLFWSIFNVLFGFYQTILIQSTVWCFVSSYFQVMINYLLVYSLAIVTINRFLTIMYPNKRFFKRQAWSFVSSAVQWMIAIILSIPNLILTCQVSTC
jgi:hypothetical protein